MKKLSAFVSAVVLGIFLVTGFVNAAARPGFGGNRSGKALGPSSTSSASSTRTLPGIRNAGGNKNGQQKMIAGVVKSIAGSSLTLSTNQGDYTVNTSSSTQFVNRVWHKIVLNNIRVGDKVRVFGRVKDLTVDAKVVRDISLPVHVGKNASSTPPVTTSTASSTNR